MNKRAYWIVTAVYWLGIFTLTHIPATKIPPVPVSDKVEHMTAYGILGVLLFASLNASSWTIRQTAIGVLGIGMIYGVADELLQIPVNRTADIQDWFADVMGIAMAILWVGAREVLDAGTLSGAELITFLAFVMRMLQPLKQLSQIPAVAQQSLAAAERLFEVMDQPTEVDRGTKLVTALQREIVFDNVQFAYDDEAVLRDISLTARRGEVVALVGDNGAGKSTMVKTIAGIHAADAGVIRFDGQEVSISKPQDATGLGIATVYQDLALCDNLDVVANLFLGREEVSPGIGTAWKVAEFSWL